mmetsp:Transcript_56244/g.182568  ORF Transcript_56244/g.182568 Transcript_56244/m.182568 type:complete len:276 (+) Transcript_56244:59-886(+)
MFASSVHGPLVGSSSLGEGSQAQSLPSEGNLVLLRLRGGVPQTHHDGLRLFAVLALALGTHVAESALGVLLTSHRLPKPSARLTLASAVECRPGVGCAGGQPGSVALILLIGVGRFPEAARAGGGLLVVAVALQQLLVGAGGQAGAGSLLPVEDQLAGTRLLQEEAGETKILTVPGRRRCETQLHHGLLDLLPRLDLACRAQMAILAIHPVLAPAVFPEPGARPAVADAVEHGATARRAEGRGEARRELRQALLLLLLLVLLNVVLKIGTICWSE